MQITQFLDYCIIAIVLSGIIYLAKIGGVI